MGIYLKTQSVAVPPNVILGRESDDRDAYLLRLFCSSFRLLWCLPCNALFYGFDGNCRWRLDGEHENCDDNGGCYHAMPWWGYMFIVVALIIVIVSLLCWCYNKDRTVDEDRRDEGSRSRRRNRQRRRQPRSDQHVSVKPAMKGEKSGPSTAPPSYDELSPSTTAYSYEYQGSR